MSLMDKIKAFFAGDAHPEASYHEPDQDHTHDHDHDHHDHDHAGHDHAHDRPAGSAYLQSPADPDEPVLTPTPEEIAAAASAEPPTTTVESFSDDDPIEPPR